MSLLSIVSTIFAVLLALYLFLKDHLKEESKYQRLFRKLAFVAITAIILVAGVFPWIKDYKDSAFQDRISSDIRSIQNGQKQTHELLGKIYPGKITGEKGSVVPLPTIATSGPVPPGGIYFKYPGKFSNKGSVQVFFESSKDANNATISGRSFLFDNIDKTKDRDRLSIYLQSILGENFVIARMLDSHGVSHHIVHGIKNWKKGSRHLITITFDDETDEFCMYVDKTYRTLKVTNLDFRSGNHFYFGRSS